MTSAPVVLESAANSPSPAISIVIVNWNTRALLDDCLTSVFTAEPDLELEVIVVDNGSRDDSVELVKAKFPSVVLLANDSNLGFCKATNQGTRRARGRAVLLLNSDTVVAPGTLSKCLTHLEAHPELGGLGCAMTYPDGRPQSSCFRFPSLFGILSVGLYLQQAFPRSKLCNWDRYGNERFQRPVEVDCIMGSFILLRSADLDNGDAFDEGYFMYAEETDLCRRLSDRGRRMCFYPDATIVHAHGASSRTPARRAWAYEAQKRGLLRFLWKWRGTSVAYLANLVFLLSLVPRAVTWLTLDAARPEAPSGPGRWGRSLRLGSARFHLRVLLSPKVLQEPWGPPV